MAIQPLKVLRLLHALLELNRRALVPLASQMRGFGATVLDEYYNIQTLLDCVDI